MAIQKKVWMTTFMFQEFLIFFKTYVSIGIFEANLHLLILNGHRSHVIVKAILQAQQLGLNIITFPFHKSYMHYSP
jgi:hypothetical protein